MKTILWRPGLQLDAKDPADIVLLEVQWADRLDTDTISSASVSADAGITVSVDSSTDDTQVLKIAGGTDREFYTVTATIDTVAGQRFERSVVVPVAEL